MPITEEQLKERKHHIGSSDVAALFGLDKFKSAYDVWLDKRDMLHDIEATAAMKRGNYLEDGVLNFAEDELGSLKRNPGSRPVEGAPLAANTDALVTSDGMPVEAKTTGGFDEQDEWGEEHTDQVPNRVILQAHVHMMAWDRPFCHVPVLIGTRGLTLAMYCVPRNNDIEGVIAEKAIRFWEKVQAGTPPEDSEPHIEVVKRIKRMPEKVVFVEPDLVRAWREAVEQEAAAKKAKEAVQAAVLLALGDAEAATCGDMGAVTYLLQHRKEYTVKANSYRVLRHKKSGI